MIDFEGLKITGLEFPITTHYSLYSGGGGVVTPSRRVEIGCKSMTIGDWLTRDWSKSSTKKVERPVYFAIINWLADNYGIEGKRLPVERIDRLPEGVEEIRFTMPDRSNLRSDGVKGKAEHYPADGGGFSSYEALSSCQQLMHDLFNTFPERTVRTWELGPHVELTKEQKGVIIESVYDMEPEGCKPVHFCFKHPVCCNPKTEYPCPMYLPGILPEYKLDTSTPCSDLQGKLSPAQAELLRDDLLDWVRDCPEPVELTDPKQFTMKAGERDDYLKLARGSVVWVNDWCGVTRKHRDNHNCNECGLLLALGGDLKGNNKATACPVSVPQNVFAALIPWLESVNIEPEPTARPDLPDLDIEGALKAIEATRKLFEDIPTDWSYENNGHNPMCFFAYGRKVMAKCWCDSCPVITSGVIDQKNKPEWTCFDAIEVPGHVKDSHLPEIFEALKKMRTWYLEQNLLRAAVEWMDTPSQAGESRWKLAERGLRSKVIMASAIESKNIQGIKALIPELLHTWTGTKKLQAALDLLKPAPFVTADAIKALIDDCGFKVEPTPGTDRERALLKAAVDFLDSFSNGWSPGSWTIHNLVPAVERARAGDFDGLLDACELARENFKYNSNVAMIGNAIDKYKEPEPLTCESCSWVYRAGVKDLWCRRVGYGLPKYDSTIIRGNIQLTPRHQFGGDWHYLKANTPACPAHTYPTEPEPSVCDDTCVSSINCDLTRAAIKIETPRQSLSRVLRALESVGFSGLSQYGG